jgi:histone-lysine N-methyltransferase MLL3
MCLKEESAEGALMRCTECKDQYHPDCLELKKENIPKMMSFGWRCMHCKKCETCRDTGDEEKVCCRVVYASRRASALGWFG